MTVRRPFDAPRGVVVAAVGISGALRELGFELGRLKTGTPPRLERSSIRWDDLEPNVGDAVPTPFSDLSARAVGEPSAEGPSTPRHPATPSLGRFPVLPQVECRQTRTTAASHEVIRRNLHRAPMYTGQIESAGPRYCPSIEDKVVRFAEREEHGVFLEPESLRERLRERIGNMQRLYEPVAKKRGVIKKRKRTKK